MGKIKDFGKLSDRQRNILTFMHEYMTEYGYPPTIRDIGLATKINSTSVVNYNLNKLVAAGYLERTEKVSRGLRLVAPIPGKPSDPQKKIIHLSDYTSKVPLIGQIVASQPVEIPDDSGHYYDEENMIDVPPSLLNGVDPADAYALVVKGESMTDAMVKDGDIVILRKQDTANEGDMVAVWLINESETTLKYFHREGDKIRLQPAHPTMDPIYVDPQNCLIHGKVLSVIRHIH
ncbi:MAG: transcriptional repressor LexA [Anaerolineae bacterium]|nr:transcriptional repressor LexA [Anaerolineae bacterium]